MGSRTAENSKSFVVEAAGSIRASLCLLGV